MTSKKTLKSIIEDYLGFSDLKKSIQEDIDKQKLELEYIKKETEKAIEEKNKISKTPKELATERDEPWVSVLDTQLSDKNAGHGFFELDWNKQFIDYLITNGFGFENDPEEEIVDRWFRTLAYNMLVEAEAPITEHTTAGFINLKRISDEHSEAS